MPNPKTFSAESFTPTQWSTAEQKADFANKLLAFIAAGFPEKKFAQAFYQRLSMCFSFIAHNDRQGFFATYFTSTEDKLRFLRRLADAPCHGSPEFTFSDVELAISEQVRSAAWVSIYETSLSQQNESRERDLLATLQAKYQGAGSQTACEEREPSNFVPAMVASQLNYQPEGTQFSLFG